MKKIIRTSMYAFAPLCILLLGCLYAAAQDAATDTLPESAYSMKVPKRVVNVYSNFVPMFYLALSPLAYSMSATATGPTTGRTMTTLAAITWSINP